VPDAYDDKHILQEARRFTKTNLDGRCDSYSSGSSQGMWCFSFLQKAGLFANCFSVLTNTESSFPSKSAKKWYDKIQLQGLIPTQYVVIRKFDRRWHVIPTAKNSFTFNKSDEERSQTLWRWANRNAEKNPSMKPEHCFTLQELQHLKKDEDETTFESRDITVMVVQKLRFEPSSVLPQGLLRVWDGTGNSPSDP